MNLAPGQELAPYSVVAYNYATASENKIHDDAVARRFGFSGGLVPGVSDYAYMTRPVLAQLGAAWLERGTMSARFLRPVYDGHRVEARARVGLAEPVRLELELIDPADAGEICAVGEAGLPPHDEPPPDLDADSHPQAPLPDFDTRPPATLAELRPGRALGSVCHDDGRDAVAALPDLFRDDHPIYYGDEAVAHPALLPHWANEVLSRNVRLGPWIHTASRVRHLQLIRPQDGLVMRGRVRDAYEHRGHDTVELDLALFDADDRPLAHIVHTAIVRPRQVKEGTTTG